MPNDKNLFMIPAPSTADGTTFFDASGNWSKPDYSKAYLSSLTTYITANDFCEFLCDDGTWKKMLNLPPKKNFEEDIVYRVSYDPIPAGREPVRGEKMFWDLSIENLSDFAYTLDLKLTYGDCTFSKNNSNKITISLDPHEYWSGTVIHTVTEADQITGKVTPAGTIRYKDEKKIVDFPSLVTGKLHALQVISITYAPLTSTNLDGNKIYAGSSGALRATIANISETQTLQVTANIAMAGAGYQLLAPDPKIMTIGPGDSANVSWSDTTASLTGKYTVTVDAQANRVWDASNSISFDVVAKGSQSIYAYMYNDSTLYFTHKNPNKNPQWVINFNDVYDVGKTPWESYKQNITTVRSDKIVCPQSMRNWFRDCSNLTTVSALNTAWDTSLVTDLNSFMYGCSSFNGYTYLRNFDTSKVTDFTSTFDSCSSLKYAPSWNTSSAITMKQMFKDTGLISFTDLRTWDTSKVENMHGMFNGVNCSSISTLATSATTTKFTVSNVKDAHYMFANNPSLTSLTNYLSFDNIEDASHMFEGCTSLTSTSYIQNWFTNSTKLTDISYMFYGCTKLNNTMLSYLKNINTSNVKDTSNCFMNCEAITSTANIDSWNVSNVTNMSGMFRGCTKLTTASANSWTTTKVTDTSRMFQDCTALATLTIGNWRLTSVTNMDQMFENCTSVTSFTGLNSWGVKSTASHVDAFRYTTGTLPSWATGSGWGR